MNLHLALLLAVLGTLAAVWCLSWQCCLHVTESRATRLADPEPMPGELPTLPVAGRFPVDTGPLPLLSELSATWDVIERQQRGWS